MRAETWIAERLYFTQSDNIRSSRGSRGASRPAVRVALAGIIIGVAVMLVTICVVVGFKQTVTEKVAGFGSHIQVVNFDNNSTYEMQPIVVDDSLIARLRSFDNVQSVHRFATKPGIIKTNDAFQGIIYKGTDYWDYFASQLVEGALPSDDRQVLLSCRLSRMLQLGVGDSFYCYFVDDDVRVRRFSISGLYDSGMAEMDELFVPGNIATVRRLNDWSDAQVSGLEILVSDIRLLDETADRVYFATANRLDEEGNAYYTLTLEQQNPQIFAWLDLLDMNVVIIILLMLAVSGFNIISGLIILILDSVTLIGTLKALGADNRFIRRIFVTEAAMLIGKGVLWGNVVGLVLCAIQYWGHLMPLDATTYYVDTVPIAFPWVWIVLLNVGTILASLCMLLAPSAIVSKIRPAQVMRFE